MGRLFGTDGVRGIAGEDLTGELVYGLGRAAVVALAEHGDRHPRLVVGRDTRASGASLESALSEGICSAGGDVVQLGVFTTPGVAFLTTELGAQAGVVISASHNTAEWNGVKVFGSDGYKLADELEDEIEAIIGRDDGPRLTRRDVGRIVPAPEAADRYLRHVERSAPAPLSGMQLVVDCAHGAASGLAPQLLHRLGADVIAINDRPDGWNINDHAGATRPDVVARAVVEHGADAGVAHDGDADRAIFADHEGNVVDGDQVLAACALDLRARGALEGNRVVTTVMANLGFRECMQEAGIEVQETKVGDRYVLEAMRSTGAILGGEQSGHIIFLRHAKTGDGLLTAVQLFGLARRERVTVAELAARMTRYPQVLLNVPVSDREAVETADAVWAAVAEAERELGDSGRVLVRPSGTEKVIRVMVEAPTEEEASRHAEAISSVVAHTLGG